jgi:putative peptidoglycan lipid II flippase
MLRLSVPVALSAGVLQLSVVIDSLITACLTRSADASVRLHLFGHVLDYPLAIGALARLNWAQLLYQFPLGVFAISLATAIFPTLSVDAMDKDRTKFRAALRHGIIVTLMEGFGASLGLMMVSYPAIRLLYQHGEFTPADTRWVALSTCFFSAAIWAFSLQQILNRAYYALHDTMTPLIMSIVTIAVNTFVEVPLAFSKLGEAGIAAGTLASFTIQAVVMLVMLDRRVGGLGMGLITRSAAKMLAGCLMMYAVCELVRHLSWYPKSTTQFASMIQLAILMSAGGGAYLGTCRLLGLSFRMRPVSP